MTRDVRIANTDDNILDAAKVMAALDAGVVSVADVENQPAGRHGHGRRHRGARGRRGQRTGHADRRGHDAR